MSRAGARVLALPMTFREKALYHQIHPAKLATDILCEPVSLYFFWRHALWLGLGSHFLPPILASVLVVALADLEPLKASPVGRYIGRRMTRPVEAARLAGDLVMVAERLAAALVADRARACDRRRRLAERARAGPPHRLGRRRQRCLTPAPPARTHPAGAGRPHESVHATSQSVSLAEHLSKGQARPAGQVRSLKPWPTSP